MAKKKIKNEQDNKKEYYNAHARLNGLVTVCMSKGNNKVYG